MGWISLLSTLDDCSNRIPFPELFKMNRPCPAAIASNSYHLRSPSVKTYIFGYPDPFLQFHVENDTGLISPLSSVSDIPFSSEMDDENTNPFQVSSTTKNRKDTTFTRDSHNYEQNSASAHHLNHDRKNIRFLKEIFTDSFYDSVSEHLDGSSVNELSSSIAIAENIDQLAMGIVSDCFMSDPFFLQGFSDLKMDQMSSDFGVQFSEWIDLKKLSDSETISS